MTPPKLAAYVEELNKQEPVQQPDPDKRAAAWGLWWVAIGAVVFAVVGWWIGGGR